MELTLVNETRNAIQECLADCTTVTEVAYKYAELSRELNKQMEFMMETLTAEEDE
jgi:hypothetical protein